MNTALLNIPTHTRCQNCGDCCGPVLIDRDDIERIVKYIYNGHMDALTVARANRNTQLTCPFRDESRKRCAIYPVRPLVCILFGVSKGMSCCKNSNTCEIDGSKFISKYNARYMMNRVNWKQLVNGMRSKMRKIRTAHDNLHPGGGTE